MDEREGADWDVDSCGLVAVRDIVDHLDDEASEKNDEDFPYYSVAAYYRDGRAQADCDEDDDDERL